MGRPAKNVKPVRTVKKPDMLSKITFGKQGIYIRIDSSVLEFFRASGPRWQSRINAVLHEFMEKNR